MAGFDELALKRLEELATKSKSGTKLPASEALELKELKLLKSAAEITKARAEIAVAKRKIEDREKYRIGGLAVAAGLSTWTDEELKAVFVNLAAGGTKPYMEHAGNVSKPCGSDMTENSTTVSIEGDRINPDDRLL